MYGSWNVNRKKKKTYHPNKEKNKYKLQKNNRFLSQHFE